MEEKPVYEDVVSITHCWPQETVKEFCHLVHKEQVMALHQKTK